MGLVQLHGVVPPGTAAALCETVPHRLIDCGAVAAVISDFAPATPAGFEALPPEDLAHWALCHHRVLSSYASHSAVLPLKPGAIFSTDGAVKQEVLARATDFTAGLKVLDRLREYAIRLEQAPDSPTPTESAITGRAHLLAKSRQKAARRIRSQDRQALARRLLAQLDRLAFQVEPAGQPKPNRLLDCAALIPLEKLDALRRLAAEIASEGQALGLCLSVTGPWPPYSFDLSTVTVEAAIDEP